MTDWADMNLETFATLDLETWCTTSLDVPLTDNFYWSGW